MSRPKRVSKPCAIPGCTVQAAHYGSKAALTCARHSGMSKMIEFTHAQAEWVRWALEGPISEWGDVEQMMWDRDIDEATARRAILDRDLCHWHEGSDEPQCTWFLGLVDPAGEFVADLLNMLEDLAPDVAGGYGRDEAITRHGYGVSGVIVAKQTEAALNAARKIRAALGILED